MSKKNGNAPAQKLKGEEGFENYYSSIYGQRWQEIKEAFCQENVYARIFSEGKEDYFLDPASLFAAFQLPLDNASRILDMCAAPGGKSLVLAHRMNSDAFLHSNERSPARKARLAQVCSSSLDTEIFERIKITNYDGALMCKKESQTYDAILLDAPCSSERHVMLDKKYLDMWTENRIKSLAMEQWALISSAYRLMAPGAFLLYSTCAITPKENDAVVERLLKKFDDTYLVFDEKGIKPSIDLQKVSSFAVSQGNFKLEDLKPEKTPFGYHILPDKASGAGPIWFSLIGKR